MTLKNAAFLLMILLLGTCSQSIMVAPPGTVFAGSSLVANPGFIAAHGDVSVISGLLIDGTGNPVPDGTVVQFFTTLGRIEEQGKTNDGVVRVNLVSDSRSGTATITAVSGGEGGGGTTPTTTLAPGGSANPGAGITTAFSVAGASAVASVQASASATVTIGSALPARVIVSADPPRITATNKTTTITARTFDTTGNPVANVPVIFTISGGTGTERLGSGGQQLFTDTDGRVTDTLRTNTQPETPVTTVTVTATTANGITGTTTVQVN